jgi:hypothetical protein
MLVTSASKVAAPGILDLLLMRDDYGLRLPNLRGRKPNVDCQVYVRVEPELRLTVRVCDVNVETRFLAGEKEQAELSVADDRGCRLQTLRLSGR